MHRRFVFRFTALFSICLLLFCSCKTVKTISYFTDFTDTSHFPAVLKTVPFQNPVIQPDDILSITLQTIDNTVSTAVNTTNSSSAQTTQGVNGYLVDKNGQVELPFIGKIKLSGLTTSEATDAIHTEADKLFKDPVVNVRLSNFKITVLGEVSRPSTYIMPSERVTLFDALGMAGDLTAYGRREDVLLMRDSTGNNRQIVRLNLNTKNIVSSPYFYLQPNDVLYVSPSKNRYVSTDVSTQRNLTLISTSVSIFSILLVILSRFKL